MVRADGAVARFRIELSAELARQRYGDAAVAGRQLPAIRHHRIGLDVRADGAVTGAHAQYRRFHLESNAAVGCFEIELAGRVIEANRSIARANLDVAADTGTGDTAVDGVKDDAAIDGFGADGAVAAGRVDVDVAWHRDAQTRGRRNVDAKRNAAVLHTRRAGDLDRNGVTLLLRVNLDLVEEHLLHRALLDLDFDFVLIP